MKASNNVTYKMDTDTLDNLNKHHRYSSLKFYALPMFWGIWLLSFSRVFNYSEPSLAFSNHIYGISLIILSLCLLFSRMCFFLVALIGCGITLASSQSYISDTVFANNTIIGFLLIATACIPSPRHKTLDLGPTSPENTSFNPSAGGRRSITLLLSCISWIEIRCMIRSINNDHFINIHMLLMLGFTLISILTLSGSEKRWHTRPYIVFLKILTTLSSIILLIIGFFLRFFSPVNPHHLSLIIHSTLILLFSYDEFLASLYYLKTFKLKERIIKLLYGSDYYKESLFWEERCSLGFTRIIQHTFDGISFKITSLLSLLLAAAFIHIKAHLIKEISNFHFLNILYILSMIISILSFLKSIQQIKWFNLVIALISLFSPVFLHLHPTTVIFKICISFGLCLIICTLLSQKTTSEKDKI